VALVLGVGIALIGLVIPSLYFLYEYAWFVGFFTSGIVYALLMKFTAPAPSTAGSLGTASADAAD
jgi:NCS1 family nucleobase:cation symporter-1